MTANRYGADYDVRVVSPTGAGVVTPERVTSVRAGAFVLAATGVMDGRRAATPWAWTP
ncbi:hypothetical protein HEP84_38910 [Streptomyces sp. RLB1-33]